MKEFFQSKYFKWGMVIFTPLAAVALLVIFLLKMGIFISAIGALLNAMMPFIYGGILAYILRPIYNGCRGFFEKKLIKWGVKNPRRAVLISRIISVLLSILLLLTVVVGLFIAVIPQLVNSTYELITKVPAYSDHFTDMINNASFMKDEWKLYINDNWDKIMEKIYEWRDARLMPYLQELLVKISAGLVDMAHTLFNLFIGLIVCIYILLSKSTFTAQSKKLLYSLFSKENANTVLDGFRFVDRVFSGFVSGNVIDSAVVGLITFICMSIFHWPYPLLIACLVGVTNLIPFFGPFIGAIPSAVLIFSENPLQALYFIIFIGVLQQVDGNLLKPKIYGSAVDLPSFWTLFAILVGGSLFGIPGLLLGVPVFTVIYTFISWLIDRRLVKKSLSEDTTDYFRLDRINPHTGQAEYLSEDFMKERRLKHKEEKRIRQTLKKEQANYPMQPSILHQGRPLEEILREKGLDEDEIELVEQHLEGILDDITGETEDGNDTDQ
ncbi:MAG: AI-2E family transporter [Firmicutes bacterium]|jgi:predicted PurR-regulated permease PerM|nr:AI-2E family transporter [Bacillota bacterium]